MKRRQFLGASGLGLAATVAPHFARAQAPVANTMAWGSMTRAARDAAYNNAAAVGGSTQIIDGWVSASATFRSQRSKHIDLAYGPGERNKWDLFPGDNPKAPCLVHIHGGYWQSRNREHFSCLAEGVLRRGWSAALPGYSLAPAATLTQIVGEMRGALDWLAAQGSVHGIAGPVILSGWSAGGHLAALLLDHPSVTAGLAISGIFELGPIRDTYLNERLKLTDEEIATLSPLRLPGVGKPLCDQLRDGRTACPCSERSRISRPSGTISSTRPVDPNSKCEPLYGSGIAQVARRHSDAHRGEARGGRRLNTGRKALE
jgi:arylformamidase